MISIKQIEKDDLLNIDKILNNYDLDKDYLTNYLKTTLIMRENNKIIGLSIYEKTENEIGLITFMGYDIPFLDINYRDGLYRSTLNHMLINDIDFGIVLVTEENYKFYKKLNIEELNKEEFNKLKMFNKNSQETISAFKVEIDPFFNRPCSSSSK